MRINRLNYEQYLIDYLEGKLSKQDKETIKRFLDENPDIAGEFTSLSIMETAPGDPKEIINKLNLYKSFNDVSTLDKNNFEEFCIAYHENDLDSFSQERLLHFINENPELKTLFNFHGKIRINADKNIRFPFKKELRKVQVIPLRRIVYYLSAGVAAAAIIIILLIPLPGSRELTNSQQKPVTKNTHQYNSHKEMQVREKRIFTNSLSEKNNEDPSSGKRREQLAKIDSTNSQQPEKVVLAAIDTRPPQLDNRVLLSEPEIPETHSINKFSERSVQNETPDNAGTKRRFRILPSKSKIIYNAMNVSIKGFNTLTESQVAVHTRQDDNGKLTAIAIDGNNFEFMRKIQRNNQN